MEEQAKNEEQLVENKPLKIMMMLVGVVVISVTVLFLYINNKTNAEHSNIDASAPIETLEAIPVDTLSESDRELLSSIPTLVRQSDQFTKKLNALTVQVTTALKQIKTNKENIESAILMSISAQESMGADLYESNKNLELKILELEKKFLKKEKIILKQKKKQRKLKTKTIKKIYPDFKLISIDIWDSKKIALVSFNDTKQTLYFNDSFMSWTLIKIDREQGCVTFKNSKNIKSTLCNKDLS